MIECKACFNTGHREGEYEDRPCSVCYQAREAAGFGWSRNQERWLPKTEFNAELLSQIAKKEAEVRELRSWLLP